MKFRNMLLAEAFVNLFDKDKEEKKKYAQEVFDMLTVAYKDFGGLIGSGFSDIDDMIENIPFWKILKKNGKIIAVEMYKDKQGRKVVAVATDGSPEGKSALLKIKKEAFKRSYFEMSDPALGWLIRNLSMKFVHDNAVPLEQAKEIVTKNGDEFSYAPEDDKEVKKYPELKPFFYQRKIGNTRKVKIMLGKPGLEIKS